MSTRDRREFLKQTAAGVAGASLLGGWQGAPGAAQDAETIPAKSPLPSHRAVELPGVHAYGEKSIAAGETIRFRTSSSVPYKLALYRLGDVEDRGSDSLVHSFDASEPHLQPIHPGSYVHVEQNLPPRDALGAIALECWVRPWRLDAYQGIFTQYDYPDACGWGLFLDAQGRVQFYLGDGGEFQQQWLSEGPSLTHRQWHHLVGTWDGTTKSLWLDGNEVGSWPYDGPLCSGSAPLRLGAYGERGLADHFLDGDLAMPVVYANALNSQQIEARWRDRGLHLPEAAPEAILGCWPLDEEQGDSVADVSTHRRHGRIINRGTWMIGGPSFDADAVPRYGEYHPARDEQRGHGLRLAADDLYDCRWETTHQFTVPESAPQGLYCGRYTFDLAGQPQRYDVTFIVRRAASKPAAPILVLCSTNTWLAYGGTPFAKNSPETFWGTGGQENSAAGAPAYCCYRDHEAGQPTYQLGLNMPWPVAGPDVLYSPPDVGYSHLMRGERYLHVWLEQNGYDFDIATDLDLHQKPEMLADYRVLMINGHSEYWSIDAYRGVDRFLRDGGSAVVLSGNTMFWRVSFDPDAQVMECRKFGPGIGGRDAAAVGELYHAHDKLRGSLMRACGFPAWRLVGLECLGWWGTGAGSFGTYVPADRQHFLFQQPVPVPLEEGQTFGHAPGGGEPRAVGHEADVRIATLRKMTHVPYPEGGTLPEEPAGIVTLARGVRQPASGTMLDYFTRPTEAIDGTCAEMIYWARPEGGRVFNGGAIAGAWALSADPKLQALMNNVLAHFGVTPRETE
ncbi:MAG: LamG domain-containing protein [Pirellulales bacterium]